MNKARTIQFPIPQVLTCSSPPGSSTSEDDCTDEFPATQFHTIWGGPGLTHQPHLRQQHPERQNQEELVHGWAQTVQEARYPQQDHSHLAVSLCMAHLSIYAIQKYIQLG